ncbi:MAG: penicillin-binding protein activator [Deltaproteobacteria bacterium]|nr:penicillin-binding protein activator [Deltaproteobacteria bacterium]
MRLKNILILLSLLNIWACTAENIPPVTSSKEMDVKSTNAEAEQLFLSARKYFENRDFKKADEIFKDFEKKYSNDELISQVYLYLGRICFELKEYTESEMYLNKALKSGKKDRVYEYALMYKGLALFYQNRFKEAYNILVSFEGRFTDNDENLKILNALYNSAASLKDYINSTIWLEKYLDASENNDAKSVMLKEYLDAADKIQDEEILLKASEVVNDNSELKAANLVRAARLTYDRRAYDEVLKIVKELRTIKSADVSEIENILLMVEMQESVNIDTVGVMLPLTGNMRLVGQDVLKGIMLGAKNNRLGKSQLPLNIVIKDSGSNSNQAVLAFDELVRKEHVSAVIGPMDFKAAEAISESAQNMGIPLILLSTNTSPATAGDYIFWNFATASTEVAALVESLNLKGDEDNFANETGDTKHKIAVMYPDNAYGRTLKKLFLSEMESRGVTTGFSCEISFKPDVTDFSSSAKDLSMCEFDTLFLPLTANQMALAAPALAASNIWSSQISVSDNKSKSAIFLVPSSGFSDDLIKRAGRYLQQARFVVGFKKNYSKSAELFSLKFVNEYKSEPSVYSAYGYDNINILGKIIKSGVKSRQQIKNSLYNDMDQKNMVIPFKAFSSEGLSSALPLVLELEDNSFKIFNKDK